MKFFTLLFVLITFLSCNNSKTQFNIDADYISKFEDNLSKRAENRINYLQLTGLFKLDSFDNTFGKDSINDFVLDIVELPSRIGAISILKNGIIFSTTEDVMIKTKEDSIVTTMNLTLNEYGSSIKLFYEQLNWQVITRSGQYYLRVWDTKNPAVVAFQGFERFKLDPEFIYKGQFTYYDKVKTEEVHSQLGVNATTNFIGEVSFEYKGISYNLDVGNSGFTMVSDKTTGDETYGGGRYIYLDLPETDGLVTLDFNYLYNPPCTFSDFTTCLYPPRQNNLTFKILAGERIDFIDSDLKNK